jgi:hypothetical protein
LISPSSLAAQACTQRFDADCLQQVFIAQQGLSCNKVVGEPSQNSALPNIEQATFAL